MEANNQEQEQDLVDVVKVNDENTDEIHSEMLKKEESSLSLVSLYFMLYTRWGLQISPFLCRLCCRHVPWEVSLMRHLLVLPFIALYGKIRMLE